MRKLKLCIHYSFNAKSACFLVLISGDNLQELSRGYRNVPNREIHAPRFGEGRGGLTDTDLRAPRCNLCLHQV